MKTPLRCLAILFLAFLVGAVVSGRAAQAQCAPGTVPAFPGSDTCILDPLSIPKYVTPLVIPPVMKNAGEADRYEIAVRQFQQQILPGGIWNTINGRADAFPATTVWSYGPAGDPTPAVAPDPASQFNYPAYTIETHANRPVAVRWINDLVDADGNYLPHLLPVDQTLHWANPPMDCRMGEQQADCAGRNPAVYQGPVPMVTHVHGAHVDGHSDGYPEAWWLPAATDIPDGYARSGGLFDDSTGGNPGTLGYADYLYRQDQPATTLWYHDHTLGMTRLNVYAGPAGFWLIRGGPFDKADNVRTRKLHWDGILPGPAPRAGQDVLSLNVPGSKLRNRIREIPIAIQDRSFKPNGDLFYPENRAFFEGLNPAGGTPPVLDIPFVPDSDIAPQWNPEAFFTTMVVNGVTWPTLDVAPALYRFRLLNGCNSRFLNLALKIVASPARSLVGKELSFYQIGAEQGFLPRVVEVRTGFATPLPGDGKMPTSAARVPAPNPDQALLMGLAERADVLVDFGQLPPGTVVRMTNTAPDAPFGGFPDVPADPNTTGQVMQFVVKAKLFDVRDVLATPPWALKLNAEGALGPVTVTRNVSLNEGESETVCVEAQADGSLVAVPGSLPPDCAAGGAPFAPKEALLGIVNESGAGATGVPLHWMDMSSSMPVPVQLQDGSTVTVNVTENPTQGSTEEWNLYNFTEDAHPIHLHLVRFQVVGRTLFDGTPSPNGNVQPWETGYKDTVIAYPGEITTVRATFDLAGLYVWHCHIVEHEDNEMMRPYVVSAPTP